MRERRYGVVGEHLVTDMSGRVLLASDARMGRYGSQKGRIVHKDDLDEPGHADIKQPPKRREQPVHPYTGPPGIRYEED